MSNKSGNSNAKEEGEKVEKSVVMSNQFSSVLSTLSSFRTQITMLQNQTDFNGMEIWFENIVVLKSQFVL